MVVTVSAAWLLALALLGDVRAAEPAIGDDAPAVRLLPPVSMPPSSEEPSPAKPSLRLIEAYHEGGSTKMIVQSRQPLVTGRSLFIGPLEHRVTVGPIFSRGDGTYYYLASAPGRLKIGLRDAVRLEPARRPTLPQTLLRFLRPDRGFEQKSLAEITAVQGDRAMIDKGTLHEVHERDLYRVYDSSGDFKGVLEIRGIGDLQSSGRLQDQGTAPRPGDYAIFLGQRRLFGIGLVGGTRLERTPLFFAYDRSVGGGLLWSLTFYDGWGLEALFGSYVRDGKDATSVNADQTAHIDERSAKYIAPTWLKKNFRYPSLVSPFVAAGIYWFDGSHAYEILNYGGMSSLGRETKIRHGIYPVVGAGIEFFPTRFFRPRIEIRRFMAPELTARGSVFFTDSTFYSLGVLTSW